MSESENATLLLCSVPNAPVMLVIVVSTHTPVHCLYVFNIHSCAQIGNDQPRLGRVTCKDVAGDTYLAFVANYVS